MFCVIEFGLAMSSKQIYSCSFCGIKCFDVGTDKKVEQKTDLLVFDPTVEHNCVVDEDLNVFCKNKHFLSLHFNVMLDWMEQTTETLSIEEFVLFMRDHLFVAKNKLRIINENQSLEEESFDPYDPKDGFNNPGLAGKEGLLKSRKEWLNEYEEAYLSEFV